METLLDLTACEYEEWFLFLHDPKRFAIKFNDWSIYNHKINRCLVKYAI